MQGIAWGVLATAVSMAAVVLVGTGLSWPSAIIAPFVFFHLCGLFALGLAVLPAGPVAAFLGWIIYRAGVVSPRAYAVVGAIAATSATALLLYLFQVFGYRADGGFWMLFAQLLPLMGGFGGYMGGRAIEQL